MGGRAKWTPAPPSCIGIVWGTLKQAWSTGDLSIIHPPEADNLYFSSLTALPGEGNVPLRVLSPSDSQWWGTAEAKQNFIHTTTQQQSERIKSVHHTTTPVQKQCPEVPKINDGINDGTFLLNDLSQCRTWLAAEEMKDHGGAA